MLAQSLSIAFIALLGAMSPGADFAVVVKNVLFHSRNSGYFTSLGVVAGIVVHMSYCVCGVAIIIMHSFVLFHMIKYIGASYLIYLGASALFLQSIQKRNPIYGSTPQKNLSSWQFFREGFLCNLLNPKATLFFLSIFSVVIKSDTPFYWSVIYASEIVLISFAWFFLLTTILSHPSIQSRLEKSEKYINKLFGLLLLGFGLVLVFFA